MSNSLFFSTVFYIFATELYSLAADNDNLMRDHDDHPFNKSGPNCYLVEQIYLHSERDFRNFWMFLTRVVFRLILRPLTIISVSSFSSAWPQKRPRRCPWALAEPTGQTSEPRCQVRHATQRKGSHHGNSSKNKRQRQQNTIRSRIFIHRCAQLVRSYVFIKEDFSKNILGKCFI